MLASAEIAVKHGFQIGVMSFVAGSFVINCVGEEGVEAETN